MPPGWQKLSDGTYFCNVLVCCHAYVICHACEIENGRPRNARFCHLQRACGVCASNQVPKDDENVVEGEMVHGHTITKDEVVIT